MGESYRAYHDGSFVSGQVIVVFKKSVTEKQARDLVSSLDLRAGEWLRNLKMLVVFVPASKEQEWVNWFKSHSLVRTASTNNNIKLVPGRPAVR